MTSIPLNQDALDETALANLIAWKSLPFGATQFVKLDANAAHKVIELLRPHLAVAQPVVNSVEELDKLPVGSVILDGDPCVLQMVEKSSIVGSEWAIANAEHIYTTGKITLPARVLYRPAVKP